MAAYMVQQEYASRGPDGQGLGPWQPGQVVDLAESVAGWVDNDAPGTLAPAGTTQPKPTPQAKDRMLRKPAAQRDEPIDRTVYKAVRNKAD